MHFTNFYELLAAVLDHVARNPGSQILSADNPGVLVGFCDRDRYMSSWVINPVDLQTSTQGDVWFQGFMQTADKRRLLAGTLCLGCLPRELDFSRVRGTFVGSKNPAWVQRVSAESPKPEEEPVERRSRYERINNDEICPGSSEDRASVS